MNMAALPNQTLPKRHSHRRSLTFAVPAKKPVKPLPAASEWDTRGMIRKLASKYPNLDPCLLGWTLLACRLQLAPDETPDNVLTIAEQVIRTDLFDTAAKRRRWR